ncbi:MAG: hypothetical protein HC938_01480 [Nitrospira sp.]|nr:hypothetical protein [Nitrospira sp.]
MVSKGKVFDIALGLVVMGTVGVLMGQTMGGGLMSLAVVIGVVLGVVIGFLGASISYQYLGRDGHRRDVSVADGGC